jgi:nanoRNase/pAp phosphatase (c-di-AMP/oligoRNAs hydrolase)
MAAEMRTTFPQAQDAETVRKLATTPIAASTARTSSLPPWRRWAELGFEAIAYGMNADDTRDYRPGQRAAEEHAVLAPLAEAGLTKAKFARSPRPPATRSGTAPPLPASLRASSMAAP